MRAGIYQLYLSIYHEDGELKRLKTIICRCPIREAEAVKILKIALSKHQNLFSVYKIHL